MFAWAALAHVKTVALSCAILGMLCTPTVPYKAVHAATMRLEIDAAIICSGTAVGTHTILTAAHCFVGDKHDLVIERKPVTILKVIRDGKDHVLVVVGRTFLTVAHFGVALDQGDEVFIYGDPMGLPDMLRFGRIAGVCGEGYDCNGEILYDVRGWHGDSGSAVFNMRGGIVGVISGGVGTSGTGGSFTLAGGYPLAFTHAQLKQAGV